MNRRVEKYINAMLDGIVEKLANAVPGGRNHALNEASFSLASASAAGLPISEEESWALLWEVWQNIVPANAQAMREFRQTFKSGWHGGLKSPRSLPDWTREAGHGGTSARQRRAARDPFKARSPREVTLNRPPFAEVVQAWAHTVPVNQDREVRDWLRDQRGVDPDYVAANNLARALPLRGGLAKWARFGGRPWNETGHRLILPCWTACEGGQLGNLVTLRARLIGKREGVPKTVSPFKRPEPYSVKRTIYANAIGMAALTCGGPWEGTLPSGRSVEPVAVIAEGDIDFLIACQKWGDTRPVFGIYAGAWCEPIAARFPDRCTVVIMTDDDPAGARYADKIAASLQDRCNVRDIERCNRG